MKVKEISTFRVRRSKIVNFWSQRKSKSQFLLVTGILVLIVTGGLPYSLTFILHVLTVNVVFSSNQ
jgi:predicted ABC-type sugar transport system permease subunit